VWHRNAAEGAEATLYDVAARRLEMLPRTGDPTEIAHAVLDTDAPAELVEALLANMQARADEWLVCHTTLGYMVEHTLHHGARIGRARPYPGTALCWGSGVTTARLRGIILRQWTHMLRAQRREARLGRPVLALMRHVTALCRTAAVERRKGSGKGEGSAGKAAEERAVADAAAFAHTGGRREREEGDAGSSYKPEVLRLLSDSLELASMANVQFHREERLAARRLEASGEQAPLATPEDAGRGEAGQPLEDVDPVLEEQHALMRAVTLSGYWREVERLAYLHGVQYESVARLEDALTACVRGYLVGGWRDGLHLEVRQRSASYLCATAPAIRRSLLGPAGRLRLRDSGLEAVGVFALNLDAIRGSSGSSNIVAHSCHCCGHVPFFFTGVRRVGLAGDEEALLCSARCASLYEKRGGHGAATLDSGQTG
jgi:hypothetical protein